MKKIIGIVFLNILLLVILTLPTVHAQTLDGTFTLNASSNTIPAGSEGLVVLTVTSQQPINAVQATISYPASKLTFEKIDTTGGAFEITAKGAAGGGTVDIARGTLKPVTGENKVAVVAFHANATTSMSEITLIPPSLIAASSTHTNIFGGSTYHVVQGNTQTAQTTQVSVPTQYLPSNAPTQAPTTASLSKALSSKKGSLFERFFLYIFSALHLIK